MVFKIGEHLGIGKYCCTNCGWSVKLKDSNDPLPPCANCGEGQDIRYNKC